MASSVDPDQTGPIGAVCSGSTLFASILNSSVMLGNYLQQTTSPDDIFICIFSWCFKGYNLHDIRNHCGKNMDTQLNYERGVRVIEP